ncbi:MAG: hypothetical protein OEZ36_11160 [Spirochaetota bacterium]|nr:hypothetical protein [Spirochaetota bacterium]
MKPLFLTIIIIAYLTACQQNATDIGNRLFVVERESASLAVLDIRKLKVIKRIALKGNLRHASMVFSPDLHYGYIASRDGTLSRINLENMSSEGSLKTSLNSIGIAISQDGRVIAVSEYRPGGITLIDRKSFTIINKIPAIISKSPAKELSRVTGLVDGAENSFICALMDSNEIWELKREKTNLKYTINRRFKAAHTHPFDALITPEGRYYITGHFQSDKVSLVDLWDNAQSAKAVVVQPKPAVTGVPVKMVHMEAWAVAGKSIFIPSSNSKELHKLSGDQFLYQSSIKLIGHPVYAMVHPNQKEIWVSFTGSAVDGKIQIIDSRNGKTIRVLDVGKRVYHIAFTPRGDRAFVSSNETDEVVALDCLSHTILKRIKVKSPSGIFGVWRAFQIGL